MKFIYLKIVKNLLEKYKLSYIILFTHDTKNNLNITTYGRTVEQEQQAADFGSLVKHYLEWPMSLHSQPTCIKILQKRVRELEEKLKNYEEVDEDEIEHLRMLDW